MIESTSFRMATPEDASAIVYIIRSAFSPLELSITTVGCKGYERFVNAQLKMAPKAGDGVFWVATSDQSETIGCLELRLRADDLFLNHIFVSSDARGSGLGSQLLRHVLAHSSSGYEILSLDVWEENKPALRWYERLGFRAQFVSEFWEVPLVPPRADAGFRITGWPQVVASQSVYGFSSFQVATAHRRYTIGMLGSEWFRITDPDALLDPGVSCALVDLDPQRSILAIVGDREIPRDVSGHSRLLKRSIRMRAAVESVERHLVDR